MLMPIYQTPYYIVFKPVTPSRRLVRAWFLEIIFVRDVCVCVCVCVSAPEGTNNYRMAPNFHSTKFS